MARILADLVGSEGTPYQMNTKKRYDGVHSHRLALKQRNSYYFRQLGNKLGGFHVDVLAYIDPRVSNLAGINGQDVFEGHQVLSEVIKRRCNDLEWWPSRAGNGWARDVWSRELVRRIRMINANKN